MKAVVDQQSLPALLGKWERCLSLEEVTEQLHLLRVTGHPQWEPLWSQSQGAVACWGSLDVHREGHSWPLTSYFVYSLAVNSQQIFFMIFCLVVMHCSNVHFVLYAFFQWICTFSFQTQVCKLVVFNGLNLTVHLLWISPASWSISESQLAFSVCRLSASFVLHCSLPFFRCFVIVQHGKPQCILYVWTLKAPLQSDPRASSLCLSLASLHASRFPQISL